MSNEIKINKITLDLAGQKVDLTVEQARELKEVLDNLFKKEVTYFPMVPIIYPPFQPIWAEGNLPLSNPYWRVDCNSQGHLTYKTVN